MAKSTMRGHYKVTVSLYVDALNTRQAAHIARGVLQAKDSKIEHFVVEERVTEYGTPYAVDLSKEAGEPGYLVAI